MKTLELKRRKDFLNLLPKNAICAELGCGKGPFSRLILQITDPKRFFIVDPYWKAYGDKYPYRNSETYDYFKRAMDKIRPCKNYDCVTFVIEYDTIFLSDYPDNFFDWIYLDTSHEYEQTLKELALLKTKIKDEGLICGHDYNKKTRGKYFGLTRAVHKWLEQNTDYELYLIDNHSQWIIRKKVQKGLSQSV